MTQQTILDALTANHPADLFRNDEHLIWEGRPIPRGYTEMPGLFRYVIHSAILWGIIIGSLIVGLVSWIVGLEVLFIGMSVLLWEKITVYRQISSIRYAISNQRVFFQFLNQPVPNLHWLEFTELEKVIWEEFVDKKGVLHFIPKPGVPIHFETYDLIKRVKRFDPTFELLPEVMQVFEKLKTQMGKDSENG
jgi:hypothetical protein